MVDAERMMKTACTSLPLAGMERHNFATTLSKKKSYEVTVEFRRFTDNCTKKINAKVSSNCILLTVFCKGTKNIFHTKVSNEKSEIFRLRNVFLNRKSTKSNYIC